MTASLSNKVKQIDKEIKTTYVLKYLLTESDLYELISGLCILISGLYELISGLYEPISGLKVMYKSQKVIKNLKKTKIPVVKNKIPVKKLQDFSERFIHLQRNLSMLRSPRLKKTRR